MPKTPKRRMALGAAACVVAGTIAAVIVVESGSGRPASSHNVSRNYRVCLLSEAKGGAGTPAAAVEATWAGLQRAAASGKVNAERLPLAGTSAPDASPYFNGALQQHCGLIVSVGPDLTTAVDRSAATHRSQQYLLVGGTSSRGNVHTIGLGDPSVITSQTYSMVMSLAGA
jgi:hypothetical protein